MSDNFRPLHWDRDRIMITDVYTPPFQWYPEHKKSSGNLMPYNYQYSLSPSALSLSSAPLSPLSSSPLSPSSSSSSSSSTSRTTKTLSTEYSRFIPINYHQYSSQSPCTAKTLSLEQQNLVTTTIISVTTATTTVTTVPSSKTGSRRIFPATFKLQVLDSYRTDCDCKGNQRATARKYNIHRRQIQKWLQSETSLRASVSSNNHNYHNDNCKYTTTTIFTSVYTTTITTISTTSSPPGTFTATTAAKISTTIPTTLTSSSSSSSSSSLPEFSSSPPPTNVHYTEQYLHQHWSTQIEQQQQQHKYEHSTNMKNHNNNTKMSLDLSRHTVSAVVSSYANNNNPTTTTTTTTTGIAAINKNNTIETCFSCQPSSSSTSSPPPPPTISSVFYHTNEYTPVSFTPLMPSNKQQQPNRLQFNDGDDDSSNSNNYNENYDSKRDRNNNYNNDENENNQKNIIINNFAPNINNLNDNELKNERVMISGSEKIFDNSCDGRCLTVNCIKNEIESPLPQEEYVSSVQQHVPQLSSDYAVNESTELLSYKKLDPDTDIQKIQYYPNNQNQMESNQLYCYNNDEYEPYRTSHHHQSSNEYNYCPSSTMYMDFECDYKIRRLSTPPLDLSCPHKRQHESDDVNFISVSPQQQPSSSSSSSTSSSSSSPSSSSSTTPTKRFKLFRPYLSKTCYGSDDDDDDEDNTVAATTAITTSSTTDPVDPNVENYPSRNQIEISTSFKSSADDYNRMYSTNNDIIDNKDLQLNSPTSSSGYESNCGHDDAVNYTDDPQCWLDANTRHLVHENNYYVNLI